MPDREQLIVFGIDFSKVPHMTSEVADLIVKRAREDMRRDYDPKGPEEPRLRPETAKKRLTPRLVLPKYKPPRLGNPNNLLPKYKLPWINK